MNREEETLNNKFITERTEMNNTENPMNSPKDDERMEEDLHKELEEEQKRDEEKERQVKEGQRKLGVMTRAKAEEQRKANQSDKETHEDAIVRLRAVVANMEEKSLAVSKEKRGTELTAIKAFWTEQKKVVEEEMGRASEAMKSVMGKTEELAQEGEKGKWLVGELEVNELEQVLVRWRVMEDQLVLMKRMIKEATESVGLKSLTELVDALRVEKDKVEESRVQWEDRVKKDEEERRDWNVQIERAIMEKEEAETRAEALNVEMAALRKELEKEKKLNEANGVRNECGECERKMDTIRGQKLKERKSEEEVEEDEWSPEYMKKQIMQLQNIARASGPSTPSRMNSVLSTKNVMGSGKAIIGENIEGKRTEKKKKEGKESVKEEKESEDEERESESEREGGSSMSEREMSESQSDDSDSGKRKKKTSVRKSESAGTHRQWNGKLPRMPFYDGSKEDWESFEEGILVRYEGMEDRVAIIMMSEVLTGKAKKTFKDIPKSVKEEGLRKVLRWLKKRLSEETPFEDLENVKKLGKLDANGKKAVEMCEEIERLVKKLEKNREKRETMMRRHLLLAYQTKSWTHGKLLDLWGDDVSFEGMKAKLMQWEYMDEMKREMGKKGEGESRSSQPMRNGNGRNCFHCGMSNHKTVDCRRQRGWNQSTGNENNGGRNGQYEREKICDHCKKKGHIKANCWTLNGRQSNFNPNASAFTPSEIPTGQKTIMDKSKAHVKMIEGSESMEVDNSEDRDDFFVIKKTREVRGTINGVPVSVVLDTGAEASLMEEKLLSEMKGVEILSVDKRKILQDAQHKPIEIVGRAILDVSLEMGRTAKIGFFIAKSEVGVIIGGRGLDAIGVELRPIENANEKENESESIMDGEEEEWEVSCEAKTVKEYCIPSGEMMIVWVQGDPDNTVMLSALNEATVEGIAENEKIVGIPIINPTEEEMKLEKDQVVGHWKKNTKKKRGRVAIVAGTSTTRGNESNLEKLLNKLKESHEEGLDEGVRNLLREYEGVFAIQEDDLGRLDGYECGIELMDERPVKQKPRIVPFAIREQLRVLVEKMKRQGVIEQSTSPWNSPIVIVKKKNGTIRLCIDYRKVNQQIKLDAQPLPHVETTLQSLIGRKWFTTIDLASGFWQIGVSEQAREITAFSCLGEHLQFRVLPFGLATSPCLFQRAMQRMLDEEVRKEGKEKKVFCYIDDILIATETREEQLETLRWVLNRLNEKGVLINPEKCRFLKQSVHYLGHVISDEGIEMEGEKVKAVREFKRPENTSEVRSFLGLASYYRKFVKGFASIAGPLHKLTSSAEKFQWTQDHERSFMELKEAITTAPTLMQPDYPSAMRGERPFVITTDASGKGIGGVLTQMDEKGVDRPVAFHSRSLRGSEKQYSIVDAEALGIYDCVQRWKGIIYGTKVIVRTDHAPLVSMFKRTNVAPRILRWATELMPFNLEIEYLKGKENTVADALSRSPLMEDGPSVTIGEDVIINRIKDLNLEDTMEVEEGEVRAVKTRAQKDIDNEEEVIREREEKRKEWRCEQGKDKWIQDVIHKLSEAENGKRDWGEKVDMPHTAMRLTLADFDVEDGVLYVRSKEHNKLLYVPVSMRKRIVKELHENVLLGHTGSKKLFQLIRREFVWGGLEKEIAEVVKNCTRCRLSNSRKKFVPELVPRKTKEPLEVVAVDLLDLGRGIKGGRYALVVIDLYSRYAGAYPIKDKKASTVARIFMDRWVLENGRVPKALLSDNGGEFVNEIMEEIVRLWKIERKTTLPYHSRANGGVERLNRTLTDILRRMEGSPEEWECALPYALYVYNNSPHSVTGETPAFLLNGRDERLPGGEPTKMDERYVVDKEDYKTSMQLLMKKTHREVNERLKGEREKMKRQYDGKNKNRKNDEPIVGDRVYVKREIKGEKNAKLIVEWEGPYRVIERNTTTAELRKIEDGTEKTVQLDRIRKVKKEEEKDEEATVRILRSEGNTINSRYTIEEGDVLDWNTGCVTCGQKKLGDLWKEIPEEWATIEIGRPRDVGIVAAIIRIEGLKMKRLFVTNAIARSDWSKVNNDDLEEALTRGFCDHANRTIEDTMKGRIRYEIAEKVVPKTLKLKYRQVLGDTAEEEGKKGMILAHSSYESLVGARGEGEGWVWMFCEHSEMAKKAGEFMAQGGELISLWMARWSMIERVKKILGDVGEATEGKGTIIVCEGPIDKDGRNKYGCPLVSEWMTLVGTQARNIKLVPNTGRYSEEEIGIDTMSLWKTKPEKKQYERLIYSMYEGTKVRLSEQGEELTEKREKEKSQVICHYCKMMGHFSKHCPNGGREGMKGDIRKDKSEWKKGNGRSDRGGDRGGFRGGYRGGFGRQGERPAHKRRLEDESNWNGGGDEKRRK